MKFLLILGLLFPLTSFAIGTRGGGDANSVRIREIIGWFDNGQLTNRLVNIADNIAKFKKTEEVIPAQIQELVAKGIIEDFKDAKYDLQPVCLDEKNIERSATTLKVDLSANPDQERPIICVNVRKLAMENADINDVLGLLFHEHARHFGLEDTDKYSINPIAEWITIKNHEFAFFHYSLNGIVNSKDINAETPAWDMYSKPSNYNEFVSNQNTEVDFAIVIDTLKGQCEGVGISQYNLVDLAKSRIPSDYIRAQYEEENITKPYMLTYLDFNTITRPIVLPMLGELTEGAIFKLPSSEKLTNNPIFAFTIGKNTKKRKKNIELQKCQVSYHFESGDQESHQMQTYLSNQHESVGKAYPFARLHFFDKLKDL